MAEATTQPNYGEETERYWKQVGESPHDFTAWEYLIQLHEAQEDLSKVRSVLLEFLKWFPLCFGYWKKLADLEFSQMGEEKAVEIYELAVNAAPNVYETWFYYCSFMADRATQENFPQIKSEKGCFALLQFERRRLAVEMKDQNCIFLDSKPYLLQFKKSVALKALLAFFHFHFLFFSLNQPPFPWHQSHLISSHLSLSLFFFFFFFFFSIFERASEKIGRTFQAHPLWDRYIQLIESFGEKTDLLRILDQLIQIPLQQYPRFFDKYVKIASQRPVEELASSEKIEAISEKIKQENEGTALSEEDLQAKLRDAIMKSKVEIHKKTEDDARKRWNFEEAIVVSYFHVKAIDEGQLKNWRSYLEFEEREGDLQKTVDLYERCLVPCALYEEFWMRYSRFLARKNLTEEARKVFTRAMAGFLNKKPTLHVAKSIFEELQGSVEVAREVLSNARQQFVGHVETILASVNLERRQSDYAKAEEIFDAAMKVVDDKFTPFLTCQFARFLTENTKNVEKARRILTDGVVKYKENKLLFSSLLLLEYSQPENKANILAALDQVKRSLLSAEEKADFLLAHVEYITNQAPSLAGYDQAYSDYLQVKFALAAQKKRPNEEDHHTPIKQPRNAGSESVHSSPPPVGAAAWGGYPAGFQYPQQGWGYDYSQQWGAWPQ